MYPQICPCLTAVLVGRNQTVADSICEKNPQLVGLLGILRTVSDCLKLLYGTPSRNRTGTPKGLQILSLIRLPISSSGHTLYIITGCLLASCSWLSYLIRCSFGRPAGGAGGGSGSLSRSVAGSIPTLASLSGSNAMPAPFSLA